MKKKILILRFSSIGDIVLTTPIVRCAKKQIDAEIHYLTKTSFKGILENNPYIDRLWTFKHSTDEVFAALKAENFDFVVDLHNNMRTLKLKAKLGTKSKAFPKLNVQKWLYVNFKLATMPDIHIVERYFETVHPLGVKSDGFGLDYFLSENDHVEIQKELPTNFHAGYVALTLGAQFKTKCLPKEKMIELIQNLRTPLVLLGGKEDEFLGEKLAQLFPERVVNHAGKLSLGQSASLLQQAKVVIAHDTGLMHIASAFQRPLAVIWGNTTPQIGMYPYQTNAPLEFFEVHNLSCRPCSKIGYKQCPKKHFKCMMNQDVGKIFEFVDRVWGKNLVS
jgi:ADP-heptose:LPS heptosyltransferase